MAPRKFIITYAVSICGSHFISMGSVVLKSWFLCGITVNNNSIFFFTYLDLFFTLAFSAARSIDTPCHRCGYMEVFGAWWTDHDYRSFKFTSWLANAMQTWLSYSTSMSFSCLICKMGIMLSHIHIACLHSQESHKCLIGSVSEP